MQESLTWWGYLHINGHIQVKRFFDSRDIDDAKESPFVEKVFMPFPAFSRENAIQQIKEKL